MTAKPEISRVGAPGSDAATFIEMWLHSCFVTEEALVGGARVGTASPPRKRGAGIL